MFVGWRVFLPFSFVPVVTEGYGGLVEFCVVFFYSASDEEVRGDVVSFCEGVAVAEFAFFSLSSGFAFQVQLVYVVLYGVLGIGELLPWLLTRSTDVFG